MAVALGTVAWAFGVLPGGAKKDTATDAAPAPAVLSVSTTPVVEGSIAGSAHLTGTVQSADPRQVTPSAAGKLASLPVKEGVRVKAGQVVATLVDTDGTLASAVATAQANVSKIRQDLDRLEHPVADATQLGQARASVKTAQEALDNAYEKKDATEAAYDRAKDKYERLKDEASASASRSSASASRAAKSSASAGSGGQPRVTVTVTATPTSAGKAGAGLAVAQGDVARDDVTPEDVSLAASDMSAAKQRRDAARDAVVTAEENLHSAERSLAAYEHLDPAGQAQISQVRTQLTAAQAQLDIAVRNRAALTVTAPVTGTVTSVPVLVGATVTPSSVLAQIDSGGFEAKASVDAAVAGALATHPSTPVVVHGAGMPAVKGRLQRVSPTTDPSSDRTDVTVTLLPGKKTIVRPGATVTIDLSLPAAHGLVVPASAVVGDGRDTVVYTVSTAGGSGTAGASGSPGDSPATVHRVVVTLVTADVTHALVTGDGLEAGRQVVVTGQTQLSDGAKVAVLPPDPATASPATTEGSAP